VQIVPGQLPTDVPVANIYRTPGTTPLGVGADNAGNIWFGTIGSPGTHKVGRLAGVVGVVPAPTHEDPTPEPAPPAATPPTTPPIVLRPASTGQAKLDPPQVGNGAINTNQICVGPPEDTCSLVYLIKEHEYVTGFPHSKARAMIAKAKKKPKLRVLGTKTVTLHGGQSAKVSVKLNALGKRLLKGKRKLRVDFTATQKLPGGKTKVLTKKTLKMTYKRR
jgi:hypothetical protein